LARTALRKGSESRVRAALRPAKTAAVSTGELYPDSGLSNQIFEAIRRDILECRLEPDARLTLGDLRKRYSVGATPLREALMRLTTDGLVIFTHNRGFRVAPVSREDLADSTQMLIELTSLAIRKAIELGNTKWEGDILSSFHQLSKLPKLIKGEGGRKEMSPEWSRLHREFHRNLYGACNSRWLMTFLDAITDQASRYVRLSIERYVPRDEEIEHREIMNAVLARDADKASRLLESHYTKTRDNLLKVGSRLF
jgi:GntR family carbon starvation induced transcriptional regulator